MSQSTCRAFIPLFLLSACGVVTPNNPFDPSTPRSQQARGAVTFEVEIVDEPATARLTLGELDVQLLDEDDQPLTGSDGLAVRARPTFASDTRAAFRFSDVVPGRWRIEIAGLPSRFSGPMPPTVTIVPGQTLGAGLLRYVPSDTSTGPGRVFGEVVTRGGRSPAVVRLFRHEEGRIVAVAESPVGGSQFDFTGLRTGRYAVVAESEGYTPDYALDLIVGDAGIAKLEHALAGDDAMVLHPITAVLEPMLPQVEGGYYTADDTVTMKVLAFGSGSLSMRLSTDPSFTTDDGEPQPFEPYAATKEVALPDTEGVIAVHAQFEARSDAFTFVSRSFATTLVRDVTPPEVLRLDAPGVPPTNGKRWVLESGAVVAIDIDGFDAHSAVSGVSVVVTDDGLPPDVETLSFDTVATPSGLVRLMRVAGLGPDDGEQVAWVTLRDRANNVSTPAPLAFDVDAHDPTLAVSVLEGVDGTLATRQVTLIFDESSVPLLPSGQRDLPIAVQVGLKPLALFAPQQPYADTASVAFSASHGQVVTFVARFIDASGRTSEVESDAFTMDLSTTVSGRVVVEGVPTLAVDHAGTRVRLFAPDADLDVDPAIETTLTDAQGRYALGPVPEGAGYRLVFDQSGYVTQEASVPTLVAGRALSMPSTTLRLERGVLSGVFRLEDQVGAIDQHGGIVVIATLSGGRRASATTVTDPSGAWRLEGLPTTAASEQWRVEGQASGYRRALAGSAPLSANEEHVFNPDGAGVARPVVLTKISGDFDLCASTGPCLPLAYTNQTMLRASLRSTQAVTRYRLQARTSFEADTPADELAWTAFDADEPLLVDISGADGVIDVYLQLETADVPGPVMRSSVVLDTVAPPVDAFFMEPSPTALDPAFTNRTTVRVRVDALAGEGAPLDGVRISFAPVAPGAPDAGAFRCEAGAACELPLPAPGGVIVEGRHVLHAFACDLAGNCSTTPASASVIYDATPPSVANGVAVRAVSPLMTTADGDPRSRSPRYDVEIDVGSVMVDDASVADVYGHRIGFDAALADATVQAFDTRPEANTTRSVPGPALGPADGRYVVRVQLLDAAGNATSLDANPFELPIVLDTQPPAVSFSLADGASVTRTASVPVTIVRSGTDQATRVQLATDGGRFDTYVESGFPLSAEASTIELPAAAAPAGDGLYTVYARFYDAAGNVTERQASIRLDRVGPEIVLADCTSCRTSAGGLYSSAQQVTLAVVASDASGRVDKLRFSVGGGAHTEVPYTGTPTVTLPALDGAHEVSIVAVDDAGNPSDPRTLRITLDRTSPVVSLSINAGATHTRDARVTLAISASDDTSGVVGMRVASTSAFAGPVGPFSSESTWTLSTPTVDGPKDVFVEISDAAGNVATASATIVLDATAPTGGVVLDGGADVTRSTFVTAALSFSADTTGYAVAVGNLDCARATFVDASGTSASVDLTLPAGDGSKVVMACFRDVAGNVSSASASIVLDTTAPTGSIVIDAGNATTRNRSVVVTVSANADATQMAIGEGALDCGSASYTALASSAALMLSRDGEVTVTGCLRDAAGNVAAFTDSIRVDTVPPTGSLTINDGAAFTAHSSVVLTTSASSDVTSMAFANGPTLDCATASYEAFATQRAFSLTGGDGLRTVTGCLRDEAGNTGLVSATIGLDTQKPTATVLLASGATHTRTNEGVTVTLTHSNDVEAYALSTRAPDCAAAAYLPTSGDTTNDTIDLPATDGPQTAYACVRDAAGNTGLMSDTIILDATAPVVGAVTCRTCSVASDGTLSTNAADRVVLLDTVATDNLGAVATVRTRYFDPVLGTMTERDDAYASTSSIQLPNFDGTYEIEVSFLDAAGNESDTAIVTVLLDRVVPTLAKVTLQGPARVGTLTTLTRSIHVKLQATAIDAEQVLLSNDPDFIGAAWRPYHPGWIDWTLVGGDGTKTVYARFRDGAMNTTATVTGTIELDTTPPSSPSLLVNGGATHTNSALVSLTLSAEGASHMRYSVDGTFDTEPWLAYQTSASATLPGSDGRVAVWAQFSDPAGNLSSAVSAQITLDRAPPTAASLEVASNASGFSSTQANVVELVASGADEMRLACDGVLDTEPWVAYAPVSTCVFDAAPGQKTVRAMVRDLAGNTAGPFSSSLFLDNVAPSSPVASSQSTTTSESTFDVSLGVASSDAAVPGAFPSQTFIYQVRGGQYAEWTDCGTSLPALTWAQSASCAGPPFSFTLRSNAENRLQVRARDRAGNVSAESTTTVVHDDLWPGAVRSQRADGTLVSWTAESIDAGDRYITVTWEPPADADVAGYRVYYGYSSGSNKALYTGTFANEGASPLDVGRPCVQRPNANDCRVTLTGVPNGTQVWVNVAAYDHTVVPAPNEGPLNATGGAITPDTLVPRTVGTVPVTEMGGSSLRARGLAVRDGLAYVATGRNGYVGRLNVVDVANPAAPTVAGSSAAVLSGGLDVYLQGPYAYVADGTAGLRTFSLANPLAPMAVDLDAGPPAGWLAVSVTGQEDLIAVAFNAANAANEGEVRLYTIAPGSCGNTSGPANPCLVGQYSSGMYRSFSNVTLVDNYLYLSLAGKAYMPVVDVTNPAAPVHKAFLTLDVGPRHLAVSGNVLYAAHGNGVAAFDVSNPASPVEIPQASGAISGSGDLVVPYGGHVYVGTSSGLEVFTNAVGPAGPSLTRSGVLIASGTDDSLGSNAPRTRRLQVNGTHAYMTTGSTGLNIVSLTRMRAIETTGAYRSAGSYDHMDGTVTGHLWVSTQANAGLEATYVNPASPLRFALSTPSGYGYGTRLAQAGELFVFSDASLGSVAGRRLTHSGFSDHGGLTPAGLANAYGLSVAWPYAYVSGRSSGAFNVSNTLRTISLRPPYTQVASTAITPATTISRRTGNSVIVHGRLYVANGGHSSVGRVEVYSLVNPAVPAWETSISVGSGFLPSMLVAHGRRLYVCGSTGVKIFDLSQNPVSPAHLGDVHRSDAVRTCSVSGNYLFTGTSAGVVIHDVSDPAVPRELGFHGAATNPASVVSAGNMILLQNYTREAQFMELR